MSKVTTQISFKKAIPPIMSQQLITLGHVQDKHRDSIKIIIAVSTNKQPTLLCERNKSTN